MALHIVKEYGTGVGHIEYRVFRGNALAFQYLVSFYRGGGRVRQRWAVTLEDARHALRRLAT